MKKFFTHYLFAITACSLFSAVVTTAHASVYQSPASIKQAVSNFLTFESNILDFKVGNIDSRLRLKSCTKALSVNFPQYAEQLGRTTVKVNCTSKKSWQILVSVYIKKYMDVLTAKHSLPSQTAIQPSDLTVKRQDVSLIRGGYFTSTEQMKNMIVRRPIKVGRIVSPSMLKPKRLVSQGDEILILAETGNLNIRVKGKALMDGFLGQRIKVKNMNSRRIFQATVISNGLVKVNM